MWKLLYGRRLEGWRGRGAGAPDLPPGKLQVVIYFQEEKLVRASLEKQPPPPLELSGSAHACLTVEFYFFYLPFLHVTGLAIIISSADAQADLRLCCLHATKSSFSKQGTYGMG